MGYASFHNAYIYVNFENIVIAIKISEFLHVSFSFGKHFENVQEFFIWNLRVFFLFWKSFIVIEDEIFNKALQKDKIIMQSLREKGYNCEKAVWQISSAMAHAFYIRNKCFPGRIFKRNNII